MRNTSLHVHRYLAWKWFNVLTLYMLECPCMCTQTLLYKCTVYLHRCKSLRLHIQHSNVNSHTHVQVYTPHSNTRTCVTGLLRLMCDSQVANKDSTEENCCHTNLPPLTHFRLHVQSYKKPLA